MLRVAANNSLCVYVYSVQKRAQSFQLYSTVSPEENEEAWFYGGSQKASEETAFAMVPRNILR